MASGERGLDDLRRNEAPDDVEGHARKFPGVDAEEGDEVEGHARKFPGVDADESTEEGDADDTEGHRKARF